MTGKCDISVKIGKVKLKNPLILASGPTGRDGETLKKAAQSGAAAVVTKSIDKSSAAINPRPYFVKVKGGIINADEWSELTCERWIEHEIKIAKKGGVPVIANIISLNQNPGEIRELASLVTDAGADIIETASYFPENVPKFVEAAKEVTSVPIIAKLCPLSFKWIDREVLFNCAKATVDAGADAIAAMDTVGPCLAIDIDTGKPLLGSLSGTGKISGPAIKPLAVALIADLARKVETPLIGIGGISTGRDVIEMIMAGATCVGICTASIFEGYQIFNKILSQIKEYMSTKNYKSLNDFRGITLNYIQKRQSEKTLIFKAIPPTIDASKCTACNKCVTSCIYNAIKLDGVAKVNAKLCHGCGLCSTVCPTNAITLEY